MPTTDASVPPTRAAPISLSALPRVMLPLASPLASSSKVRLEVCWLTCAPIPKGGTRGSPASLTNEGKYGGLQGLAQLPRIP
jgi:hypothetical protein